MNAAWGMGVVHAWAGYQTKIAGLRFPVIKPRLVFRRE